MLGVRRVTTFLVLIKIYPGLILIKQERQTWASKCNLDLYGKEGILISCTKNPYLIQFCFAFCLMHKLRYIQYLNIWKVFTMCISFTLESRPGNVEFQDPGTNLEGNNFRSISPYVLFKCCVRTFTQRQINETGSHAYHWCSGSYLFHLFFLKKRKKERKQHATLEYMEESHKDAAVQNLRRFLINRFGWHTRW